MLLPGIRAGAVAIAVALAGCNPAGDIGYVEIRTTPTTSRAPAFYLDAVKLDPVQKGVAVLKQRIGTAKLIAESVGGQVVLCEVAVRKNRITTVTVSVLDRPPRCQCRNVGPNKACVS
jgi:hypothetical protein